MHHLHHHTSTYYLTRFNCVTAGVAGRPAQHRCHNSQVHDQRCSHDARGTPILKVEVIHVLYECTCEQTRACCCCCRWCGCVRPLLDVRIQCVVGVKGKSGSKTMKRRRWVSFQSCGDLTPIPSLPLDHRRWCSTAVPKVPCLYLSGKGSTSSHPYRSVST